MKLRLSWLAAAAIVATWIGGLAVGADAIAPRAADLVRLGGNYGPRTWDGGWWRLLVAATVHAGWLHVAVNAIAIAVLGTVLERRVGALAIGVVLIGATLVGSAASLAMYPYDVTVGASCAVAGLCGALAVTLWRAHDTFTPGARLAVGVAVAAAVAWGVRLAMTTDAVDHAGHLAGLATGVVLGFLIGTPRRALGGLALAIAATLVVILTARPPIDIRARAAECVEIDQRFDRIVDAVGLRADGPRLADTLEAEVVAPYREAAGRLVIDDRLPARDLRFATAFAAYAAARIHALELFEQQLRTGDDSLDPQIDAAQAEARAAGAALDE